MTAEIFSSFNALQNELNQAKITLKDYDENIKRLIGRDPSESTPRNQKRSVGGTQNDEFRGRYNNDISQTPPGHNNFARNQRQRNQNYSDLKNDEPPIKKRSMDSSVFKRLDKPRQSLTEDDYNTPTKLQMHSRIIVTPREIPSRQDALKAQDNDEKSKARNRRMFGALLGTLQKFRQEETKLKTKEEKRAQVEKKLEEQEVLEKAKIKKERYELFLGRKKKQQEIRIIEQKMLRIKEQSIWEEQHKHLGNYIRTATKPHIYYLPRKMTPKAKEKLDESKKYIDKLIEDKRHQLHQELEAIENKFKKEDPDTKDLEDGEIDDHDEIHAMLNAELDHAEENTSNSIPQQPENKSPSTTITTTVTTSTTHDDIPVKVEKPETNTESGQIIAKTDEPEENTTDENKCENMEVKTTPEISDNAENSFLTKSDNVEYNKELEDNQESSSDTKVES